MGDDIVVIGRDSPVEVIGVIRDRSVSMGQGRYLEVALDDYQFAFDHPEIYTYLGCGMEWSTKVHYFEYTESE